MKTLFNYLFGQSPEKNQLFTQLIIYDWYNI